MKKLLLCRHAKSSWNNPYADDHDRPLSSRGFSDSPKMALRLKKKNIIPDLILSSDATRAKSTALITADYFHLPKNLLVFSPDLYHATVAELLAEIRKIPPKVQTLFVFGHNPGLHELIGNLGGEIENLPTCGQYGFIFEVEDWEKIEEKNAKKWFFDYPKNDVS